MTTKKDDILLPEEPGVTYSSNVGKPDTTISKKHDNTPYKIRIPNFDGPEIGYDEIEINDKENE
ncbi:MAG: hypothetical protein GOV02_03230 [Candidatus Aenigmarchaeota archaeon]|nr:hypothetical protein [Candidatus Aenigmarchaeota archaeon]